MPSLLVADDPPDVVLLDLLMPGLDGCEVARRLTRTPVRPPLVIAVTGCGTEHDRARTAAAGCHLHLLKPVHPATLAGLLRRVAEVYRGPTPRAEGRSLRGDEVETVQQG